MIATSTWSPFQRLLWKEYRAQRTLWLAVLALGLFLQIMLRFLSSADSVEWAMVCVVSMLFIAASAAVAFAGEREERTANWLLQISAPPMWTLFAKWSFLVMGWGVLTLILSAVAILLSMIPRDFSMFNDRDDASFDFIFAFMFVVAVMIWSSLGSLVSRRVITSIPTMFIWWVVTMVGPCVALPRMFGFKNNEPAGDYFQFIVTVVCFVSVGVLNVCLGWRWCQGRYFDAQILGRVNQWLTVRLDRVLKRRRACVSRLPIVVEPSYAWLRVWQRLVWQERHREDFHRILLWIGCAVALILALLSWIQSTSLMFVLIGVVVLLPFVIALLGFRFESEGQPYRFLNDRGVTPTALWLARHAVWFPRAVWIPMVIWAFGVLLEQIFCRNVDSRSWIRHNMVEFQLLDTTFQCWKHPDWVIWSLLLIYGFGHAVAMMLRRVVLAVGAGLVAYYVGAIWFASMVYLHVPLWWSLGFLVVWLFGLSAWYSQFWLNEVSSMRVRLKVTANVVVPLLVLAVLVVTWRACEVSGFGPTSEFSYGLRHIKDGGDALARFTMDQDLIGSCKGEIARLSEPRSTEDQVIESELAATAGGVTDWNQIVDQGQQDQTKEQRKRQFLEMNRDRVRRIMAVAKRDRAVIYDCQSGMPYEREFEPHRDPSNSAFPHTELLGSVGDVISESGELDNALDHYCAALRVLNYAAARGPLIQRWLPAARQQQATLIRLVRSWANHPDQTRARLKTGIQRIQHELAGFPSLSEAATAQFLRDREFFDHWMTHYRPYFPWELARGHRVLESQLMERFRIIEFLTSIVNHPGSDTVRIFAEKSFFPHLDDVRFVDSTPELHSMGIASANSKLMDYLDVILNSETTRRQAQVALALQLRKLSEGTWPESLADLAVATADHSPALPDIAIVDPWNGEQFQYNAKAANQHDLSTKEATVVSSVGQFQVRAVPIGGKISVVAWTGNGPAGKEFEERCCLNIEGDRLILRASFRSR